MGFFSYDCKHCDHPMLSPGATDEGINEWMSDVVMFDGDNRLIGEYDGYGRVDGYENVDAGMDAVWVHRACWEVAGKPEGSSYDGPSRGSDDQGWFFNDGDHDLIDPRITNEAERARLLAEGVKHREAQRYAQRAREVHEWLDPEERKYHEEGKQREPWRFRFSYSAAYSEQKKVKNGWWLRDKFAPQDGGLPIEDDNGELLVFKGTEDEVKAHLASLWAQFIESDECRAYVAHREAEIAKARAEHLEEIKKKGRYEVSYGPAPKGDTIKTEGERPWEGRRTIYRVEDRLTYKTVITMDGPDKALGVKTFVVKPEDKTAHGYASPEWAARVEEVRAAGHESHRQAKAEARRLNKEWAAAGYPMPEEWAY